jgi:anti-anti-sigma factor
MPEHTVREAVVVVTGALDASTVGRWRQLITDAAALCPERLVVDMARVPRVDAAAIGLLLQVHRGMVRAGGQLTLRAVTGPVGRMLRLARVDHVLHVQHTARATAEAP